MTKNNLIRIWHNIQAVAPNLQQPLDNFLKTRGVNHRLSSAIVEQRYVLKLLKEWLLTTLEQMENLTRTKSRQGHLSIPCNECVWQTHQRFHTDPT